MPALVCTLLLMLTVADRRHPRTAIRAPTAGRRIGEVVRDFLPALPAIVAPVLMIAGMTAGAFTPTEAAAVTAVYVILISAVVYRELTLAHLLEFGHPDGAQHLRDPDHRRGRRAVRLDPRGRAGPADLRGGAARASRAIRWCC